MPVHKKPSRLESNKDVRRILLRHRVDLTQLAFSCHGRTVSFSGDLMKDGGRDFSASEIDYDGAGNRWFELRSSL